MADVGSMVVLTLPYPVSANAYWASRIVKPKDGPAFVQTYVTSEAKAYKVEVAKIAKAYGVVAPITGRVVAHVRLYPHRPQDWASRSRRDPSGWDDDVRSIDLDNANKVLLDSLKGVVFNDDRWVWEMHSTRMEPDGGPARVIVAIKPLAPRAVAQQGLQLERAA